MLKIVIVGCGKIADGHVEQIRATGRAEVVAICDQEPLMAEQLGTRFGIANRYSNMTEMLERETPDVVHIATPPDSHVAIALAALSANCHVFIEKPFAPRADEAAQILEAANAASKKVSVNYLYNFESPALQLADLLQQGKLGDIVHLDTSYGYNLSGDYGLAVMADPGHWVHRLPGRLFHNVLDHVLAKVVGHLGEEITVKVLAFRRRAAIGVASVDAMPDELRFMLKSGVVSVNGSISAHGRPVPHTLRVVGTSDSVEIDYANRTLVHSAQQTQPSAVGRLFPPWTQARRYASNGWRNLGQFRRHQFHFFQGMRVLLNRFYDAIEHDGADPVSHQDIMKVCKIIDQIVIEMQRDA